MRRALNWSALGIWHRTTALLFILFAMCGVAGGVGLATLRIVAFEAEADRARAGVAHARTLISKIEEQNLGLAELIAARPNVQGAFRAHDREALLRLLLPTFTQLNTGMNVDNIHLHTPETVTLLRLHQPNQYGDTLTALRPMILAVNDTRTPRTGMELGKNGLAIRGAVPVLAADGTHLGVLEVGSFVSDKLLNRLASNGMDLAVFRWDSHGELRQIAKSSGFQPVLSATQRDIGIDGDSGPVLDLPASTGTRHAATAASLRDWRGNIVGVVEVTVDVEAFMARFNYLLWCYICGVVMLLAVGLGLGLLGSRKLRLSMRDLKRARSALLDLERGKQAPMSAALALRRDEIGQLGQALDSLGLGLGRQKLVMRELNHRIKNILVVAGSLATETLRSAGNDPIRFRDDFVGRLRATVHAQDLLLATDGERVSLDQTVRTALAPWLASDDERRFLLTNCPAATLSGEQAKALVLALHELATNASKFGALSLPSGNVSVRSSLTSRGEATLEWVERGGPVVSGRPIRTGFGLKLLERSLAADLGASAVATYFEPTGLRAEITFPPSEIQSSASDDERSVTPMAPRASENRVRKLERDRLRLTSQKA